MPKPIFTYRFINSDIAPACVEFTTAPGIIQLWNFGDGNFAKPDSPSEIIRVHIYEKAGTFQVLAEAGPTKEDWSDPVTLLVKEKEVSWWTRFWNWLMYLFGYD